LHSSTHDAYLRWFEVGAPEDDVIPWQQLTRTRYLHRLRLPGTHRHVPFPRRPPFGPELRLFIGDMWPNLSSAALEHVAEQRRRLPQVERYLARCQAPDEALLPTLLLNASSAGHQLDVVNDRKRYIRWEPGSAHPKELEPADVPAILSSGDFFARKVGPGSAEVMDLLDADASRRSTRSGPAERVDGA
jgi:hypothetical protein